MNRRLVALLGRHALTSGGLAVVALGLIMALPILLVEVDFRRHRARRRPVR